MPEHAPHIVPDHVTENIDAALALRAKSERRLHRGQRAVESLTGALGKPRTLYVLLSSVLVWASYNHSLAVAGGKPFDPPPYFYLQGVIAVYAAMMTTIILITQSRQTKDAERNAHLELQMSLLAEQRTAKIIALLEELRRDLPNVQNRVDPVADALQEAVPPTAVSSALDETMNADTRDKADDESERLPSAGN